MRGKPTKRKNPNQIALDDLVKRVSLLEKLVIEYKVKGTSPNNLPKRHYEPWDTAEKASINTSFTIWLDGRATVHQRTKNAIAAYTRTYLVDKDYNHS